jgi:hypothetical protein
MFAGAHENGQLQSQCEMVGGEIGLQVLGRVPTANCQTMPVRLSVWRVQKLSNLINLIHYT